MIALSAYIFIIFILLAAYDSFYWHIYRLKLYAYNDTRKEHLFHTGRNIALIFVIYFLYTDNHSGIQLWLGLLFVIADLFILLFDLIIENDGRKRFGGISKWEYVLHVMANGIYFASLSLLLASKDPMQWALQSGYRAEPYPDLVGVIGRLALIGSSLSLIVHLILCFVRRK